jgi:hypothetical protein
MLCVQRRNRQFFQADTASIDKIALRCADGIDDNVVPHAAAFEKAGRYEECRRYTATLQYR